MKPTQLGLAVAGVLVTAQAWAEDSAAPAPTDRRPGRVDVGGRIGYSRPVGAFDAGTRATDLSFGGIPFGLDATYRLTDTAPWSVSAGAFVSYVPTTPTLCTTASECISSVGHDSELVALARVRGPRLAFVLPEAEFGSGWSWSSRLLVDHDSTSSRRWNGPLLLRAALVPSIRLGAHTRLGLVLGASIARSTSFTLEGPGLERHGLQGARLHGTLDMGLRFGADFGR